MLPLFGMIGTAVQIFTELYPLAHTAVTAVEAAAPQGTPGADKLQAATKMVNDALNAGAAVAGTAATVQQAVASGNHAQVDDAIRHTIEMALSLCKTFNLFPKAGIVQSATPLGGEDQNAPGG